jgi:DNA-binding GntR family transcriptional regulator
MTNNIEAIQKKRLYRDEIKEAIKQAILAGTLKAGERIVETRWAKQLGVSQSPVREALRDLETVGLIESIPYQGSYVKEITQQDIMDNYRVRMALEPLGAEDACRFITEDQLAEIKCYLDGMIDATEKDDYQVYIDFDTKFHNSIMQVSRNKTLKRLWEQVNVNEWTYIGTKFSEQNIDILAKRHMNIYNALLARDAKTAAYEAKKHIEDLWTELSLREKQKHI